jgi:hypothetical protein
MLKPACQTKLNVQLSPEGILDDDDNGEATGLGTQPDDLSPERWSIRLSYPSLRNPPCCWSLPLPYTASCVCPLLHSTRLLSTTSRIDPNMRNDSPLGFPRCTMALSSPSFPEPQPNPWARLDAQLVDLLDELCHNEYDSFLCADIDNNQVLNTRCEYTSNPHPSRGQATDQYLLRSELLACARPLRLQVNETLWDLWEQEFRG